jgi:hypothetical protein
LKKAQISQPDELIQEKELFVRNLIVGQVLNDEIPKES